MMAIEGQTIWLTGAGSGIGQQLAILLAQQGNFVIVSGRREQPLNNLVKQYPKNICALPMDVSDASAREQVSQQLSKMTDSLDTLIMGAGTVIYEDQLTFNNEDYQQVFGANFFGMVNTMAIAKPLLMKAEKKAHVVGISSLSMVIGFARAESYGSSKAAADYFLHSLLIDLPHNKFDVSIVRPGFVETPMTKANDFPMPFIISPENAAQRIVKGMEKRKRLIAFPRRLNMLLTLLSWFPSVWYGWLGPKTRRNSL